MLIAVTPLLISVYGLARQVNSLGLQIWTTCAFCAPPLNAKIADFSPSIDFVGLFKSPKWRDGLYS